MNRQLFTLTLLFVLAASPVLAQKVYVDYDRSADFDTYDSFAWADASEASLKDQSPLAHSRIKNSIEHHLGSAGLTEDTESPDLYVTYNTSSKEEVSLSTTSMGDGFGGYDGFGYGPSFGYDPYWGGGGMGSSTTTSHTYEVGTLIVDLWDAKSKTVVWRGSAEAVVKSNPEKLGKQIDKALAKMIKTFDRNYRKGR